MKRNVRFGLVGQFRVHKFLALFLTILSSTYFRLINFSSVASAVDYKPTIKYQLMLQFEKRRDRLASSLFKLRQQQNNLADI